MEPVKNKKIGLLFGSFNPIHNGHIALGRAVIKMNIVDEVWYVVSPHNPHKDFDGLAPFEDRLEMVRLALEDAPHMIASDVEQGLPVPSYTFQTLRALREQFPETQFSIVAGADIVESILTWKEAEEIITHHDLIVRERNDEAIYIPEKVRVTLIPGVLEVSSTEVREYIESDRTPDGLVPPAVWDYIKKHNLYK